MSDWEVLLAKYFDTKNRNYYAPLLHRDEKDNALPTARWIAEHDGVWYVQSIYQFVAKPDGIPYETLADAVVAAVALMELEVQP